jgi:DNA modification methylase
MRREKRNPLDNEQSLTTQLKHKDRRMRGDLKRLAAPGAAARPMRNDVLPDLEKIDIPLVELKASKHKVRKIDPAHLAEVTGSISEFGFSVPVVVGKNNHILDGQVRVEAAKMLGLLHVPCIRVKHLLSDAEERAFSLAARRLGEKGQWDLDELKIEFEELILEDAPIEVSGFSFEEVDQVLIAEAKRSVEQGPLAPKAGALAVVRTGDIFQVGSHRVICGDATDPGVVARVTEGDPPARMALTDVPYNIAIVDNVTRGDHREFKMASGEMSDKEFGEFNSSWIAAVSSHVCDGGMVATFIDWRGYHIVHAAATNAGLALINVPVWNKSNAGMGSLYRSKHEFLPIFKKGEGPHVNNVKLGKNGRSRSNVWDYAGASSLGSDARRGLKEHPTVKPTTMLKDFLLDVTHRGDIVIDPFLGSGSTLIAAQECGRLCRGVEIDPLYVDVIIRRFEEVTGIKAVLVETGETFAELAARRAKNEEPPARDKSVAAASYPIPDKVLEDATAADTASHTPDEEAGLNIHEVLKHMTSMMKAPPRESEDPEKSAASQDAASIDDVADAEAMAEYEFDALAADQKTEEAIPFEIDAEAPSRGARADANGAEVPNGGALSVLGASLIMAAGGPGELGGVLLVDLQSSGAAAIVGLEEGDLVLEVGGEKVTRPEELVAQIVKAREDGQEAVFMEVYSKGQLWDAEFQL